jgi:D-3-phosphoglycerate dehydrogenase
LKSKATVVSLHIPQTPETQWMVDEKWISSFENPFWFINTARGKSVVTADLVAALQNGKIRGAALDVLEYEKSSFENLFTDKDLPEPLQYLIRAKNVLLTPHVAGWTVESHQKLAQTIVDKVRKLYKL